MCGQGGLLTARMRNMWSGEGPASSSNSPVVLILGFWSTENESPIALPWEWDIYLLPQIQQKSQTCGPDVREN